MHLRIHIFKEPFIGYFFFFFYLKKKVGHFQFFGIKNLFVEAIYFLHIKQKIIYTRYLVKKVLPCKEVIIIKWIFEFAIDLQFVNFIINFCTSLSWKTNYFN
jgi:hypothetical protein